MTRILTGAPVWVWPLLVVLIFIGVRAMRDRQAPVGLIYAMPLLGVMAVRSTAALPAAVWVWAVFAAAYVLGGWAGHHLQAGWLLGREGRFVRLKGEILTFCMIMLVFWANFAGGFLQAVAPDIYGSAGFHVIFAVVIALSAGSFAGRALRVWQSK